MSQKHVRGRWGTGSVVSIALCAGAFVALCAWLQTHLSEHFTWWWLLAVPATVFVALLLFGSRGATLSLLEAEPADPTRHRDVLRTVEDAARRMGVPTPAVYVSPLPEPNAYSSTDAKGRYVIFFQRMVDTFPRDETAAVIAHEVAHLKNRDMVYMRFFDAVRVSVVLLVGAIALVFAFVVWFFLVLISVLTRTNDQGVYRDLGSVTGLTVAITAVVTSLLIRWGSRSRELMADRVAAEILPDPLALARGLRRLERAEKQWHVGDVPERLAALCIVSPFVQDFGARLMATHPSIDARVRRLEKFAGPAAVKAARQMEEEARQRAEVVETRRREAHRRAMVHEATTKVPSEIVERVPFEPVRGEKLWGTFEAHIVKAHTRQGRTHMEPGDAGRVYVSTHRAVFFGGARVEWRWTKVHHYDWHLDVLGGDAVIIAVTNRQTASGLLFDAHSAAAARRTFNLALAVAEGRRDEYVADLAAGSVPA